MRVLIVHETTPEHSTGDRIRFEKIRKLLLENNIAVFEAKLPLGLNRNTIFNSEYIKHYVRDFLPFNRIKQFNTTLSIQDLNSLLFSVSLNYLRRLMIAITPDFLLSQGSKSGWIASTVAKEFRVPCIIDMHGLAFAEAKGNRQKNWSQIYNLENEAFRNCDYLVAVSERMKDFTTKMMDVPEKKLIVAPNGSEPQQVFASYDLPLRVIYAGGFSYWENVDAYLDIAQQADPKKFSFYLAGNRSSGESIFRRIEKEHLPIKYLGCCRREKLFFTLSKMHVGIAPSSKDLARIVACPVKVFDYMAVGLPVITPKIGDWGDLIEDYDCGVSLKEDKVCNYIQALNTLKNKEVWIRKSENAKKIILQTYTWEKTLQPIVKLIA